MTSSGKATCPSISIQVFTLLMCEQEDEQEGPRVRLRYRCLSGGIVCRKIDEKIECDEIFEACLREQCESRSTTFVQNVTRQLHWQYYGAFAAELFPGEYLLSANDGVPPERRWDLLASDERIFVSDFFRSFLRQHPGRMRLYFGSTRG